MKLIFYLVVTFFLIILQTMILPGVSWFGYCFDLQIVNILYLSLLFSHYSILFSIILIGCTMDCLSGAPFFYYTFSYFWIWVITQGMKRFVFSRSIWFLLMISLVSVLMEHVFLILSVFIQQGKTAVADFDFVQMLWQNFFGIIMIPVLLWILNLVFQNYLVISKLIVKKLKYT